MKTKEKTGSGWFLVGILLAVCIFFAVALMFSNLRVQELSAEVQYLQADQQPKQVHGMKNDVNHRFEMKH